VIVAESDVFIDALPTSVRYYLDAASGVALNITQLPDDVDASEPLDELPNELPTGKGSAFTVDGDSFKDIAGVGVDGDKILVSSGQSIYCVDSISGRVVWDQALPKQSIRRYDSPWTRFGRAGDKLFVACYEGLFVLDAERGKLIWSVYCGPFGNPWPTIHNDRVFVAATSPQRETERAVAIFTGKVAEIEPRKAHPEWVEVTVDVEKIYKGRVNTPAVIATLASREHFGYEFEAGCSYLIYAIELDIEGEQRLATMIGARTQLLELAQLDLTVLERQIGRGGEE
jgi:hypothetical protein